MKTMGLIGGMSWESTVTYYRFINQGIKARLGGHHSAKMFLYNADFAEIEHLQKTDQWSEAGKVLAAAAQSLEAAGAEFILLCTNTMHKVSPAIEMAIKIPFLHIADATADAIKAAGIDTVGLLATRFTMEEGFYIDRLRDRHGLSVLVPDADDRAALHRIIYEELVHGKILPASRSAYLEVVARLRSKGARGVVLGCTEIGLLIGPDDLEIRCFDTTVLHAESAVNHALGLVGGG